MRRAALLVILFVCVSASVNAQVVCRSFVAPDQHTNPNGAILVAPGESSYPVIIDFPPGAQRVSIIKWAHWIPGGLAPLSLHLRELIERAPYGTGQDFLITGYHMNGDGTPVNFAESTPLLPGERYVVYQSNSPFNPYVGYHLAVHYQVCQ